MGLEVLTKDDVSVLEGKLSEVSKKIDSVLERLDNEWIESSQVCKELNISTQIFNRLKGDLMDCGMRKIGGRYKILRKDLAVYMKSRG